MHQTKKTYITPDMKISGLIFEHPGRPSSTWVTGYIRTPNGHAYILGHYKGLCNKEGDRVAEVLPMPEDIKTRDKMPLWNFLLSYSMPTYSWEY